MVTLSERQVSLRKPFKFFNFLLENEELMPWFAGSGQKPSLYTTPEQHYTVSIRNWRPWNMIFARSTEPVSETSLYKRNRHSRTYVSVKIRFWLTHALLLSRLRLTQLGSGTILLVRRNSSIGRSLAFSGLSWGIRTLTFITMLAGREQQRIT